MATLAVSRGGVMNNIMMLERLTVGSQTIINGFTIRHEAEGRFHLRRADESMFGSAQSVSEWIELVKNEV